MIRIVRPWWRFPAVVRGLLLIVTCLVFNVLVGYRTGLRAGCSMVFTGGASILYLFAEGIHRKRQEENA